MSSMGLMPYPLWIRLLTGLCLLVASTGAYADLLISGSSTILPVIQRAAAAFTAETGIRLRVSGGGSDAGVTAALSGKAHIGMVSRALHPDEARRLVATPIGRDAVAVYVHERNPLRDLSHAQVTDIYRGRYREWRELAANTSGRIVRVGKQHGRSTRELFDRYFDLLGQEYPADTHLIGANAASILYVSIDPQAIGYVSVGSLERAVQHGAPVRALSIDGIAPTRAHVQSVRYPYLRPLNLVTRGAPQGEARRFIDWLRSDAGQALVEAEGFLALAARP